MPQRTEILAGTLAENVALFDPDLLTRAGRGPRRAGPDRLGRRPAGRHATPGSARAATCSPPGRSSWWRSPGSWSATRTWSSSTRPPRGWTRSPRRGCSAPPNGCCAAGSASSSRTGCPRCGAATRSSSWPTARCVEAGPLRESRALRRAAREQHRPRGRRGRRDGGAAGRRVARRRASWRRAPSRLEPAAPADGAGATSACRRRPTRRRCRRRRPPARMREIFRLATNDPRYGARRGRAVPRAGRCSAWTARCCRWLWARPGRRHRQPALAGRRRSSPALLVTIPMPYYTGVWFPRVVGPADAADQPAAGARADRAAPGQQAHPGRGGRPGRRHRAGRHARRQRDRPGRSACVIVVVDDAGRRRSSCPALFFVGTMVVSGLAATLFGPRLERAARADGRRPGRVRHRAGVVAVRGADGEAGRRDPAGARPPGRASTPCAATGSGGRSRSRCGRGRRRRSPAGCCRSAAWALYLAGRLCRRRDADRRVHAGRGPLVRLDHRVAGRRSCPSARVWTRRTVAMTGVGRVLRAACRASTLRPGTAPAPPAAAAQPLRRLELRGFSAVHEDGTVGVRDVDLTVERGELVLVVGPVGRGQVLAAARAGRDRAPHRRAALERRAGHRAGGCSCGRTRSATWPSCRGCCPARWPTTSGSGTRSTRPTRCRPPSSSTTSAAAGGGLRPADRAQGHPAVRRPAAAAGAGPGAGPAHRAADRRRRVVGAGRHHRAGALAGAARARGDGGRLDRRSGPRWPRPTTWWSSIGGTAAAQGTWRELESAGATWPAEPGDRCLR